MDNNELRHAIKLAGSQNKLAQKLGVTRYVINHWLNREIHIPVHKALLAEAIFEGKILAEKLAPHNEAEILFFKKYWKER